jgi:hypothetical protein
MSPSMQPFETVILLLVQGVLYLYYWVIPMTAKPTCYYRLDQSVSWIDTQAWLKKPTLCSSHGKEKNTSESLEIQRGLHDISVLITLFLLMTLKPTMIDLPDHLHYLTYLSLSGVSTKEFAMQYLYWYGGQCSFGTNHQKQYTVCVHECYYSLFTCQSRSLCSFISKSLSTVGQGRQMHPGSLPKNLFCSTPIVMVLM